MLYDIDQAANSVNWASLVRHLLLSLGFYEVWLNQGVGNYKSFISLLKQRLTDTFIQNWLARLGESSRADFYKTFARFQMQPYLEKVNICIFSKAFSKLRVSSHRLEIEAGRWTRPRAIPRDDRKCHVCEILEDEFHFVIECPMYYDIFQNIIGEDLACTILFTSLQNTARTVLDSVSHAIGKCHLRTLILQYESAIPKRLLSNRRVQFTDVYPVKGECNSRTHIL